MKKMLFILTFLLSQSFVLFSSHQNYFLDGNNRIELRVDSSKKYILFDNEQSVSSLLQNTRQTRAGRNETPSSKMRATDFRMTEWTVVEANEMQLSNITQNENIFQRIIKNNSFFKNIY